MIKKICLGNDYNCCCCNLSYNDDNCITDFVKLVELNSKKITSSNQKYYLLTILLHCNGSFLICIQNLCQKINDSYINNVIDDVKAENRRKKIV